MAIIAELKNQKDLCIYKQNNNQKYEKMFNYTLYHQADDFYITKNNNLIIIINNNIYLLRQNYELICANFVSYKIFDCKNEQIIFFIEKDTKNNFSFNLQNISEIFTPKKIICTLNNEKYKIEVFDKDNFTLFNNNCIQMFSNGKTYIKQFNFNIKKLRYSNEKLVMVDENDNIQIFNYKTQEMLNGFKSVGKIIDFCINTEKEYFALATLEGIFVIDFYNRNIIKKKMQEEIKIYFKQFFLKIKTA